MGSPQEVSNITGSSCYERFSIHQVVKFAQENTAAWEQTSRVDLISSFVITLLAGIKLIV